MDLVHGVGLGETERMVIFLDERRHFFDIPCVVVFKDHSCFVVSENRGIEPSLLALVSFLNAHRKNFSSGSRVEVRSSSYCLLGTKPKFPASRRAQCTGK